jgi:CDP-glycerol glycerophosphotransferase (TagB/SpsB family)
MIEKIVEQIPDHRALITKYHDTEKLIASSDGLITFFSTTAIDAVLLRKPLMLINLTDDREFFPFASMGVAQGIYRKEDIAPALENMLAGYDVPPEKYEEASKLMNGPNDGCALERVLDLCYQMLDGREVVK